MSLWKELIENNTPTKTLLPFNLFSSPLFLEQTAQKTYVLYLLFHKLWKSADKRAAGKLLEHSTCYGGSTGALTRVSLGLRSMDADEGKGLKRNQGDAWDNSFKLLKVKMPPLFHPLPHIKNQNTLLDKSYQGCSSLFPQNRCAIFHCTSIAHLQELSLHLQGCLSNKIQSRPIFTVERVSQAALPAWLHQKAKIKLKEATTDKYRRLFYKEQDPSAFLAMDNFSANSFGLSIH